MEQTIHELMMTTKANEYLIAVGFLFAFMGFWALLFKAPRKKGHD